MSDIDDKLTTLGDNLESRIGDLEKKTPKVSGYLEDLADDTTLNRMIQVRSIPASKAPQPGVGKMYFDSTNKKLKIYIDRTGKWADILFTTTSTTTSSSTSTSTTTT
jgi:hypothetical protein